MPMSTKVITFTEEAEQLSGDIANAIDLHFGPSIEEIGGTEEEKDTHQRERDEVVSFALLTLAARLAVDNHVELKVGSSFLSLLVEMGQEPPSVGDKSS